MVLPPPQISLPHFLTVEADVGLMGRLLDGNFSCVSDVLKMADPGGLFFIKIFSFR